MTETTPRGAQAAGAPLALVGQSVPRKEDLALLTGTARFIDDIRLPGMLHAKILRSTVAHARLLSVDTSAAASLPGVRGTLTGADILGKVKPWGDLMQDLLVGDHFPFATDKVLYEGQEVAAVAADTSYQALDALEAIRVEYDELPVVLDAERATAADATSSIATGSGSATSTRPRRRPTSSYGNASAPTGKPPWPWTRTAAWPATTPSPGC
jgi:aerobic carbon-monoxide dehydrogenase large subunit